MENRISNLDAANRNSPVLDGVTQHTTMNSLVQSYGFDLNDNNRIMTIPLHSTIEPMHAQNADLHVPNFSGVVGSNVRYHHTRNVARDASRDALSATSNSEFREMPNSASAIASFLAARDNLPDNFNNFGVSVPTIYSSEVLTDYVSNEYSNSPTSRFGALSKYCEYNEVFGSGGNHWDIPKYPGSVVSFGRTPTRTELQCNASVDLDATGWISSNGAQFRNELSLTLGTSHPSVISGMNIQDQCLDMTSSVVAHNFLNETRFASEQTSCNSEELSPSLGSHSGTPRFSKAVLESRYLCVIQELLGQIASYAFENLDQTSSLAASISARSNAPFSPSWPERETFFMDSQMGSRHEVQMDPALQRRVFEINKAKLLTLLEMVDDCYNQCMDELHTVVSAFHEVTKLNPHIHARFALQTISSLYKNLREKISNYFIAMEAHFNPVCDRDSESSFETSFIPKQWALQQLKKKDHRLWRPQRGLPERSVSVLRAWMFQNFLHPYPKDSEKHLLAVKSGLTRSQVSNWFINARVRLWKPLIEEMYADMNHRKVRQNENAESNYRSTNILREI